MKKERILGKQTGCDVIDGVYHIAPMYVQTFDMLRERRVGVDRLITTVTDHCVELNAAIERAQSEVWARIREDLGLDPNKTWEYKDGVVTEVKPSPDIKGGR
jgi:hypothetical protein